MFVDCMQFMQIFTRKIRMGRSFQQLRVWSDAVELFVQCEKLTQEIELAKRFGLADQIRRSALSISSNIAEGAEGGTDPIYLLHVRIAIGSAAELRTQILCAERIGLIEQETRQAIDKKIDDVVFPLYKLRAYLRRSITVAAKNQ